MSFSKVCGRVRAYVYGSPDAFETFLINNYPITGAYVTGVSLTAESNSVHIWTFVAGSDETSSNKACPCDLDDLSFVEIPDYVGNNYFCEAATNEFLGFEYFIDDPLWDGLNCGLESRCCDYNTPPYFVNYLGETITVDKIEARLCFNDNGPAPGQTVGDDIRVEQIEIYVAP